MFVYINGAASSTIQDENVQEIFFPSRNRFRIKVKIDKY